MSRLHCFGLVALSLLTTSLFSAADEAAARLKELDRYWSEVSRAVSEGDFEGYKATCHPEGVLVSGTKNTSQPLTEALARWKKEFDATKAGKMKASVEFRFSRRVGDATTAHETGIFCYSAKVGDADWKREYVRFVGLLVKKEGRWVILMEDQQSLTTKTEFDALSK